jgi:hypothetical protein
MIKSILYLDEAKLYSMSSQLLDDDEASTGHIPENARSAGDGPEGQEEPAGSGKVPADALKPAERSAARRSSPDHELARFEARLAELGLVDQVDSTADEAQVMAKSFVRVTARASLIDAARITAMLSSFNELGEALAHVTHYAEIQATRQEIQNLKDPGKDKARLAELRQIEKRLTDTAELAKQNGLYQDPKFLKHLALVTEFGFPDQIEVQQRLGQRLFSTCLKQDGLREPKDLVLRKYSRKTEKSLVVLGVVTQSLHAPAHEADESVPEGFSVKAAITNMVNHIAAIENSLVGRTAHEVVIDPIAVYVVL